MSEPTVKDIMLRHANNEVPLAIDRRILIKHIEQLEAQLETYRKIDKKRFTHMTELQAQLEAVREYLQHREACTIYDPMVKGEVCTCGLEAAIGDES